MVYTPPIVFAIFGLFFIVEKFFPIRETRSGLIARLVVNGVISGLAFVIAIWVVRPLALSTMRWAAEQSFGLQDLAE